jgi:protein phosphatase
MTLILRAVAVSDPGLVRTNNEDAAYADGRLIAVADGMGGLPAGEVASEIAVQTLTGLGSALASGGPDAPDDPDAALRDAVARTNQHIRELVNADPARAGMGTTITAVLLLDGLLTVAHIGDSRGYLLRGGTMRRLTRDDTFVQELVDQGVLTPAEARRHPQRSLVTRAVQGANQPPALGSVPAEVGDRLLLCSDGLSDVVEDHAIGQVLAQYPDSRQAAEHLVKLTHQGGAPDNVTVIVADVVEVPA